MTTQSGKADTAQGHTPGPWRYRPHDWDDWGIVRTAAADDGPDYVICQARNPAVGHDDLGKYREDKTDPYEANARLIAEAPTLLAHLEWAERFLSPMIEGSAQLDMIRFAIRQAKGPAQ